MQNTILYLLPSLYQSPRESIAPEGELPISSEEKEVEGASVVVSFRPPRNHATCREGHLPAFRTYDRESPFDSNPEQFI